MVLVERGTNVVAKVVFSERKVVLVEGVLIKAKVVAFSKRDFKTKLYVLLLRWCQA